MPNSQSHKAIAIGSMVWSLIVGAGGLFGIRLIQLTSSDGHPGIFPAPLVAFYVTIEALLAVMFICILRQRRWAAVALTLLLAAIVITTILCLRSRYWAPDFMPSALILEALWLGPWVLTAWRLWARPA